MNIFFFVFVAYVELHFELRSVSAVTWTDREGLKADETQYFIGQNPGPDAWRTLAMAGLHVFTDARIDQYPDSGINFQHLTHFVI